MSESETEQYKLRWRGRESGPYPLSEINRMLDQHEIGTGHEILHEQKWIVLGDFFAAPAKPAPAPVPMPELPAVEAPRNRSVAPAPKPATVSFKVSVTPAEQRLRNAEIAALPPRNRLVFAFLAICLGFAGIHNFYARQWLTGLLQFLLSIATSLLGFGIIAAWLWAMVEALVVRKDGHGIEMT
jgi:TM2 domain-containing membrane protein YozV